MTKTIDIKKTTCAHRRNDAARAADDVGPHSPAHNHAQNAAPGLSNGRRLPAGVGQEEAKRCTFVPVKW